MSQIIYNFMDERAFCTLLKILWRHLHDNLSTANQDLGHKENF